MDNPGDLKEEVIRYFEKDLRAIMKELEKSNNHSLDTIDALLQIIFNPNNNNAVKDYASELTNALYKSYIKEIEELKDIKTCQKFLASITEEDILLYKLQEKVQIIKKKKIITLFDIFKFLGFPTTIKIYKLVRSEKHSVISKNLQFEDPLKTLSFPVLNGFQYSILFHTIHNEHKVFAYLQLLHNIEELNFEKGSIIRHHKRLLDKDIEEFIDNIHAENIDILLLVAYYTLIEKFSQDKNIEEIDENTEFSTSFSDFFQYLELEFNPKEGMKRKKIIDNTKKLKNVVGIIKTNNEKQYLQALQFKRYDKKTRTIYFSSPYFVALTREICKISKETKTRKTHLSIFSLNSFSKIRKTRCKVAITNVLCIIILAERKIQKVTKRNKNFRAIKIEITIGELLDNNPEWKHRLEQHKEQKEITQDLKRVSQCTIKLFKECVSTELLDTTTSNLSYIQDQKLAKGEWKKKLSSVSFTKKRSNK
ncbi:MAG: hypothetical protein IJ587_04180 [Synergistaceae bacterium]|nr:hypothetical protein [Synergistaceae bacterium]